MGLQFPDSPSDKNRAEYCHLVATAVLNKLGVFGMFPMRRVTWITIESWSGSQFGCVSQAWMGWRRCFL